MKACDFLAGIGPVCIRCGLPATVRFGADLVEPDSGDHACDGCAQIVHLALLSLAGGGRDIAERTLSMTAAERKESDRKVRAVAESRGWRMDYADFRRAEPAVRHWHKYDVNQRTEVASSHRQGFRQRQAIGEFWYSHPRIPDRAYDTAKQATVRAHEVYMSAAGGSVRREGP